MIKNILKFASKGKSNLLRTYCKLKRNKSILQRSKVFIWT